MSAGSWRRWRAAGAIFLAAWSAGAARAQLQWAADVFEGEVRPLQKTLQVAFSFRNAGDAPINIRQIQTNCDCLEARTDKTIYLPGEAGLVAARFVVGERTGPHERTITVVTDDSPTPKKLTVRVEVPAPVVTAPRSLEWRIGAEPREQAAILEVAAGLTIRFTETYASNDTVAASLETIEEGRRYRVLVTPLSTTAATNAAVRAKGVTSDGEELVVSVYANVR